MWEVWISGKNLGQFHSLRLVARFIKEQLQNHEIVILKYHVGTHILHIYKDENLINFLQDIGYLNDIERMGLLL